MLKIVWKCMSIKVKDTLHSTRAYTTNSHAKSDETKLRDIRKILQKKENYHARQVKNQYHNSSDTAKESREQKNVLIFK